METLLKAFDHCTIRNYRGGKEIRTKNLDSAIEKARSIIKKNNLQVEIFEQDSRVNSFSVREIK